jgi:E3 ubiquitin-protein ligase UHRF1
MFEPKEKPKKKAPLKRKAIQEPEDVDEPAAKVQRVTETETELGSELSGPRRSSRNAGKNIDYAKEQNVDSPQPVIHNKMSENDGPMGREAGQRVHNP